MADKRQRRLPEFKTKVVLAALKGYKTLVQLSRDFGVSTVQIGQWKNSYYRGSRKSFSIRDAL